MAKSLYLIDGMALIYRAHFALIKSPIFTSKGVNTSALYGFINALIDVIDNHKPDLMAIALDTSEPTERHIKYPAYKAQREDMPEDISTALPHINRFAAALNIPVLRYPGYEADDIIGTLAVKYAADDLKVVMVTPDKDFAQLVGPYVTIYKPGRMGNQAEILGEQEVKSHWNVPTPKRVADVLGLWGDASDNIPGIPGFGEKTAKKLIGQYGSIEGIYDHLDEMKGKQLEKLEQFKDQALLSRDLATINTHVPVKESLENLTRIPFNEELLKPILIEFEFNSIGRRLFGADFKAGRGFTPVSNPVNPPSAQGELFGTDEVETPDIKSHLKTISDIPHTYTLLNTDEDIKTFADTLAREPRFCFDLETDRLNHKLAKIAGIAFSWKKNKGFYVNLTADPHINRTRLEMFAGIFANPQVEKSGQNLKFDLSVLAWQNVEVSGPFFDTMIAHALLEPDRRHGMDALSEQYLGYSPIPITQLIGDKKSSQINMFDVDPAVVAEYAAEDADVTWQLREIFEEQIKQQNLEHVFHDIEMPLLQVIIRMEKCGIRLDQKALQTASRELSDILLKLEERIYEIAGTTFNINSPKQLGEILFDKLALIDKAKKTRTGQYATDESILSELAVEHEIARLLLEYREASKLKSTYVDALPESVFPGTQRIHTSFSQVGAITGRLASSNPNLQNIPVRTSMGQQIRAAFIASDENRLLLSADYSQIELRVMAELSGDQGMMDAFGQGLDIHAATAARVYRVDLAAVTSEMRRNAKMVNFGIIYGISAFGLSQRLSISRTEASSIIEQYFKQYPNVKTYMDSTIASCRENGYVETLSGRRRWIRDINSANATIRNAAERTAINSPIQGTAADMIKIAMIKIDEKLRQLNTRSVMILQVHDELLFDLWPDEKETVIDTVKTCMQQAIPMKVPIVVDTGTGANWLEAH